jgi:hypothetical protein
MTKNTYSQNPKIEVAGKYFIVKYCYRIRVIEVK